MEERQHVFPVASARFTSDLSEEEFVRLLTLASEVDSVAIGGSGGSETLNPVSDFDILVVLADAEIVPECVLTTVGRRNTEVYFVTTDVIDDIFECADQIAYRSMHWGVADRIRGGRVVHDRHGRLERAQVAIQSGFNPTPDDRLAYGAWFNTNYDLWQTRRMLRSDDPVYLTAVDYRLLQGLSDLLPTYFTARRLPWRGEKDAIRYLEAHNPEYLASFCKCLSEGQRTRRFDLYAGLLRQALFPLGGLWPHDATVASIPGEPATVPAALQFWERLMFASDPTR